MFRTAVIAALLVLGCSKNNGEVTETPTGASNLPVIKDPAKGAPGGAATEGAAPSGPDGSFKLAVSTPAAGPAGAEAVARVSVTPTAGWHMNKDYPTRLKLTAPDGVQLHKAVFELADVTKLDDNELAIDVKLTAAKAGTYKVDGELKFAVCTPETCDPKKQAIAFEVVAQ